ncbi:hypothetical protein Q8F55_008459 [Vanrija albida]|uniref:Histidine kinase n=1 Tax=Vanrija albida TaxID=181172 RepID=A0ABR3PQX0_9TREE
MSRATDGDDRAYGHDGDDDDDLYVLDHIPLHFLEAYPFPAFVVDEGLNDSGKELGIELLWGNERWLDVSGSAPLDECTTAAEYAALAAWMRSGEGIYPLPMRQGAASFVLNLVKTTTAVATIVTCQPGWDHEQVCPRLSRSTTPVSDQASIQSSNDHLSSSADQSSTHGQPVPSLSHSSEWEISGDSASSSSSLPLPSPVSILLPDGTISPAQRRFPSPPQLSSSRTSSSRVSSTSPPERHQGSPPSPLRDVMTPANGQGNIPASAYIRGPLERTLPKHHSLSTNFTNHDVPAEGDLAGLMTAEAEKLLALLQSSAWDDTPLGPHDSWPQGIKTALRIMLSSPTLDSIWWGPIDNIHIFYNAAYRALVNHPTDFGKPANKVWATLWKELEPMVQQCMRDGKPTYHKNDLIFYRLNDRGRFIEQYHTWSMIPIVDRDTIVGGYSMCLDTTHEVLAERRSLTIRTLTDELAFARAKGIYYDAVADVLGANPLDAPFAICYQVDEQGQTDRAHLVGLSLKSTVGVPHAHRCAPEQMTVELPRWRRRPSADQYANDPHSGQSSPTVEPPRHSTAAEIAVSYERREWPIARALSSRQCVIVDNCAELVKGLPVRQWDELPDQAIVIPIIGDTSNAVPPAVLILGLNRHSQLDDTYLNWVHTMRGYLASALTSINTFEAAVLQRLESEQMERERAKSTWIRGAAAELLEPLTIITPPLERVLNSASISKHQRRSLQIVQGNVQRLENIVAMLLDYNHIETGRMTGEFIPGDLGQFVTDIVDLFVPAVDQMGIKLTVRTEEPSSAVVFDPVLLEVVVSNLIASTLKQSNSRFLAISVDYEVRDPGEGWAHVAIIDPEVGIPIDAIDGAAGHGNTGPSTHTGLALSLAKEIIGLHGGAITAKSGTKQSLDSASYNIRLPLGGAEDDSDITPQGSPAPFGAYTRQAAAEVVEAARGSETVSLTDESSSIASRASSHSRRSQSQQRAPPSKRPGLERRMAESTLDTSMSLALDEARRQHEMLAGCISHEIRTPINAILQHSSLIKDNLVSLRQDLEAQGIPPHIVQQLNNNVAAIESIYQCGLVQERVAGDVQSLAQTRLDDLALQFVPVSVRDVVQRAVNVFSAEAQAKNIDIQVVFGPTLDAMALAVVKTDPVRVSQVVSNIIANVLRGPETQTKVVTLMVDAALDPPETPESCALPRAALAAVSNYDERVEGQAVVPLITPMIEDTGVYIYFSLRDSFEVGVDGVDPMARRSSEATATVRAETGMSLYISKKVTELLGGRMEVETTSVGSETRFFIEARAADPTNPFGTHPSSPATSRSASPAVATAATPLHVLIVEDSLISQTILKRQMAKAGFVCDIANNGVEALDALGINVSADSSPSPPSSSAGSIRFPLRSHRRLSWPHSSLYRRRKSGQSSPGLTSASSLVPSPPPSFDTGSSSENTPSLPSAAASEHSVRRYDVVLMDLEMPIMDGITAVRHLRAHEDGMGCDRQLVLALTNSGRQAQIDAALAAGMDEVIVKPYRLPRLIKAVHLAVDRAERGEWGRGD